MFKPQDIILTVDYHENNTVIRFLNGQTGEERLAKHPTDPKILARVARQARDEACDGQQVWWVMESMTGWPRVGGLMPEGLQFVTANVLGMPRAPKATRKKTDRIDTARLQRECLHNTLPVAYQPDRAARQLRRMTDYREDLVRRRTALRNWINRYLAHETWQDASGLWSNKGMGRLRRFAADLDGLDAFLLTDKLDELEQLQARLDRVEDTLKRMAADNADARRLDAIYGIGPIGAISIVARIGDVTRFRDAEALISFAGLAPGVHQSDGTLRSLHVGGPGTDARLRHYLVEASVWARKIPRYAKTYERAVRRRGKKVGRLVVSRLLLRSIYKMLRDEIPFDPCCSKLDPQSCADPRIA